MPQEPNFLKRGTYEQRNHTRRKKKPKSMLEEQTEKDLAFCLETGIPHSNTTEFYLPVARNHADKIVKDENSLKKVSGWKGERKLSLKCQEWVKIKPRKPREPRTVTINGKKVTYTPEPMKRCGKPVTHVVSWEIERFYGKKHAEEVFCKEHAEEWVKGLKKGDKRLAVTYSFEPITIREI